jgi:DNA helicase IV
MLYRHLDGLRDRASGRLAQTLRQNGGTPQARTERDVNAVMYAQRIAQLDAAENGLCFGRTDFHDGPPRYIGRMGIRDEKDDYEPLLLDWRAPAARPFYLATAVSPDGVSRRRHIKTRRREVIRLDDEVLDLATAGKEGLTGGLTGEAALLAALNASRTGQMSDIVETIQVEQDWIIRSPHKGVLVVEGGPGTGKTAVALHRAAYLLYTHREQLARRAVLIVGPNPTFLRYVGQVLPSLGETSVLMSTIGELYPGISARRDEPAATARLKGTLTMAALVAAAVRDRQGSPALEVEHEREVLRLDRRTCARIRDQARRARLPHNRARPAAHRLVIDELARQVADRIGYDVLGGGNLLSEDDLAEIRRELRESLRVRSALAEFWPLLTPQELIAGLLSSPRRLASAGRGLLTAEQRDALQRPAGGGWTPADVPLLDEAAELLGEDDRAARARGERERRRRIAYARGVLDLAYGSRSVDLNPEDEAEILSAYDILDAERLADRYEEEDDRTAVERAAADRAWAFGHIVVDEAQEVSPMAWRMLIRRCPTRSMTVVGDMAQAGDLAGGSSWPDVLTPHLGDRWRLERLTINYRTPAEIADVAGDVLAAIDPELQPPRPVRETGAHPWSEHAGAGDLAAVLAGLTEAEAGRIGPGRLAVIVPESRLAELTAAVAEVVPDVISAEAPDLDRPVVVLSVTQAKGLEFDSVLVADPRRILAGSPRGLNDLYVAITRATQRLGVVHEGELPKVLSRLRPLGAQERS